MTGAGPAAIMAGMARTRPNPPLIHMIVAIAIVLAPALLAMALFTRIPDPPVNRVDPAPVLARAAAASPYPIEAPRALPDGWVCTRARWTAVGEAGVGGTPSPGNTLGLGYLTPQQLYLAVDQRDAQPDAFVVDVTRGGAADGASEVGGVAWRRYLSQDGRTRALVRRDADHVTIVSGDTGYEALEAFAGTLAAQRP